MELTAIPTRAEPRELRRATDRRMLGGVAAGLAEYFDVDVVLVRIVLAVVGLVGGLGIPLYLAAWALIPEEGSDRSIADHLVARVRPEAVDQPWAAPATRPVEGNDHDR